MTIILAIESSCDETGVGICELSADGTVTLLADEVASSVDEHARFGGVVPEIASRAHLEALGPTMRRALEVSGVTRPDVVAATIGYMVIGPVRGPILLVCITRPEMIARRDGWKRFGNERHVEIEIGGAGT